MTYFTCFFKLKKNKYQVCMVSHASQRFVPILAYTLSSNHFLGLANRVKIPDLFNYNDDTDKKINDGNRRLQLFEKLFGDKIYSNEYKVKIYISQIDEEIAKKVLFKLVENRIFFIIQPGASKKNRTIDVKVLIKISSFIYEKYKVIPIISGIKKEEHLHNEIIDNIPQAVSLINYNLSLHQATYIISKSIFYLGNDTGTMHLANSFNVPIFAFTKHDINPSVYPYNIGINKMFQFTKMIENDYAKYNDIESVIKEIELSIFNK